MGSLLLTRKELLMRELNLDEANEVAGGMLKCVPGDGQVEGSWIDRWLRSFPQSGM